MKNYRDCKIGKSTNRGKHDWYIYYFFVNPETGKFERIRKRYDINSYSTQAERQTMANRYCKAMNNLLKKGFNPFASFDDVLSSTNNTKLLSQMTFTNALLWALEKTKGKIAISTYRDRDSCIKQIKVAAKRLNIEHLTITNIKRFDIRSILEQLQSKRKFSNTRYNGYLDTIKGLMGELAGWDIVETNIARDIKRLKREEPNTHIPITDDELLFISAHLKKVNPRFYLFCKILYKTGIRPNELLNVKVEDLNGDHFILRSNITKSKKERFVYLDEDLKNELGQILSKKESYIFSTKLLPGPTLRHRNEVSKLWKQLIKTELGINKTMYSLKHTRGEELRKAGISIEDIKDMYGHSSSSMTLNYVKNGKEVAFNRIKQIESKF